MLSRRRGDSDGRNAAAEFCWAESEPPDLWAAGGPIKTSDATRVLNSCSAVQHLVILTIFYL
jgi:hypothetical protein